MPIRRKLGDALTRLLGKRKAKKSEKKSAKPIPAPSYAGPPSTSAVAPTPPIVGPPIPNRTGETPPPPRKRKRQRNEHGGKRGRRATSVGRADRRPERQAEAAAGERRGRETKDQAAAIQAWNRHRRALKRAGQPDPGPYRGG